MINTMMTFLTLTVLGCWVGTLLALSIIFLAKTAKRVIQEFDL
jgi:hypothetical protein